MFEWSIFFCTCINILHFLDFDSCACVCAKLLQLCPTLCNPMNCSPPGFSVYGISQARILQRGAMPSSRGSSEPRDRTLQRMSPALTSRFFIHWAPGNPLDSCISSNMINFKKFYSRIFVFCPLACNMGFADVVLEVKKPTADARDVKRHGFNPWVRKIPLLVYLGLHLSCSYLFSIYILFLLPSLRLINSFYYSILLFVKLLVIVLFYSRDHNMHPWFIGT